MLYNNQVQTNGHNTFIRILVHVKPTALSILRQRIYVYTSYVSRMFHERKANIHACFTDVSRCGK